MSKRGENLQQTVPALEEQKEKLEFALAEAGQRAERLAISAERMKKLAEFASTLTGDPMEVFGQIARALGTLMGVRTVSLSEIKGERLVFLSIYDRGQVEMEAGSCELAVTPCATVLRDREMRVYQDVTEKFPEAKFLQDREAYSYCGFPALDGDGNVTAVFCVLDDKPHEFTAEDKNILSIVARRIGMELERRQYMEREKAARQALDRLLVSFEDEKARSEAILTSIAEGISIQSTDFRVIYQNATHRSLAGDHKGSLCHKAYENQDNVCDGCPLARTFADQGVHREERSVRMGDETIYVEITASPLLDSRGNLIAGIEIVRDITERKRAEKELHVFRHAISGSLSGFAMADLQGNMTYTNRSFLELWGFTTEAEVLGKSVSSFWQNPEDAIGVVRILEARGIWSGELKARHRNGSIRDMQVNAGLVQDERGNPISLFASFLDITEQKKEEKQIREGQKLEALGTLAGGIAHDFNNMLNGIIGYANLLKLENSNSPLQQEYTRQILQAGNRATDLVKQILTFSRRKEQPLEIIDPVVILKEALTFLKSILPATIEIKLSIDSGCGRIRADHTQLYQLIMNLSINAYHAMRERGGILNIVLDKVRLNEDEARALGEIEPGSQIRLLIRDSGVGMEPALLDRIFEPYFTTREQGEGSGLGLATVHGIVRSSGGAITVQSRPGAGSTFAIYFPAIDQEIVTEPIIESREKLPRIGKRVLFVDDGEFNVRLGQTILEKLECRVDAFTDSPQALDFFRKNPDRFDVVITDQTMPKMTGIELAGEILKIRPDIHVIMVTGHSELVDEQRANAVGIRDFLMKPLEISILIERLR